jgi:Myb DNA-binding like
VNRPLTPALDHPNFSVQIMGTPAAQTPFPYPPFSSGRIRTESLCSIKSNREVTVANLQPRKNIRTEDQKIIDIKRESRERLSNKDLDKSQLRMFDMIYFNPQNNPMKPKTSPTKTERPKKVEVVEEPLPIKQEAAVSMPVPQLRLNANGEMVLDEASLVVENEQQKQNRILLANTNVVYDDDLSANYGFYKRQKRTKEWSQEETVKFYRCLNTIGTDFSLMLNLFPNRSRRDIKLKFKKEEKNNPQLINKALLNFNIFDLDKLQREMDEEEAERKKESEAKSNSEVKELVKRKILKKQQAKLRPQETFKSKVEKNLVDGPMVLNIVDNKIEQHDLKENLQVLPIAPKKRQYKRKADAMASRVMEYFNTSTSTATSTVEDGNAREASYTNSALIETSPKNSHTEMPQTKKSGKDDYSVELSEQSHTTSNMKVETFSTLENTSEGALKIFECKMETLDPIDPPSVNVSTQTFLPFSIFNFFSYSF